MLLLIYILERLCETLAFSLRFARAVVLVRAVSAFFLAFESVCVAFVSVASLGRSFRVVLSSRGTWTGSLCPLVLADGCNYPIPVNILVVVRVVIDGLTYLWELQMCLPVSIPSGMTVLNCERSSWFGQPS